MRELGAAIGRIAFMIAWVVVGLFVCSSVLFVVGYAVAGGLFGSWRLSDC